MAKSGYDFYLGKIMLPVAPEKVSTKINGQNKTVNRRNQHFEGCRADRH